MDILTFDHAYSKKFFIQLSIFVNVSTCKNHFIPSVHSSDTVNFRALSRDWPHPFLTMLTPKIFNHLSICMKFLPVCKKSVNSICSFLRNSQILGPETRLVTPISDHVQPKMLSINFIFCEFLSTCKKWDCLIDLFWIFDLKNPHPNCYKLAIKDFALKDSLWSSQFHIVELLKNMFCKIFFSIKVIKIVSCRRIFPVTYIYLYLYILAAWPLPTQCVTN